MSQDQEANNTLTGLTSAVVQSHPIIKVLNYGTSGFRAKVEWLDGIFFRTGILAGLRAACENSSIGVMITASHNPASDNGVKVIDSNGEMLPAKWETYATELVKAKDASELSRVIQSICQRENFKLDAAAAGGGSSSSSRRMVFVAHDTRPSGPVLLNSLKDGIRSVLGVECIQYLGTLTTPQCHYLVQEINSSSSSNPQSSILRSMPPTSLTQEVVEQTYLSKVTAAFTQLLTFHKDTGTTAVSSPLRLPAEIYVDCSNGVGTCLLRRLIKLPEIEGKLKLILVNVDITTPEVLNEQCGADFVQKEKVFPKNFEALCKPRVPAGSSSATSNPNPNHPPKPHFVTLDGDADRIVYFYPDSKGLFRLVDGDKITTLLSTFLKQVMAELNVPSKFTMGVVQTAYANGSSTLYLTQKLQLEVSCVPTGVKHLHHKAKAYSVGVYFEANGHGTVVFSEEFLAYLALERDQNTALTLPQRVAVDAVLASASLLHQTCGDAVADMLMIEACLHCLNWDVQTWDALYEDLPSRQLKVSLKEQVHITTNWEETRVISPPELQAQIDLCVKSHGPPARAFVRPSGTEPAIRIYAEAETQPQANQLAEEIKAILAQTFKL